MNSRCKNLLWRSHPGRVQSDSTGATPLARQCWDELSDQSFPEDDIARLVFRPLYEAVQKWATEAVDPSRISPVPRSEEFLTPKELQTQGL